MSGNVADRDGSTHGTWSEGSTAVEKIRRGRGAGPRSQCRRAVQGRHPAARRGLRTRGRLPRRVGARHHLRNSGVGLPDRRPRQGPSRHRLRPPRPRSKRRARPAQRLQPRLPGRRHRRSARGDAEAGGARRHRGPLDGRHRDLVLGGAVPRSGTSTRRRRRPDQHHDRRPDSSRAVPSGAATAGRRQGSRGRARC